MRKVLFELLGVKVYSYGFMIALGIILAGTMFIKRAKSDKYNEDHLFNALIITIISGMLGAKLLYIVVEIKSIIHDPSLLRNIGEGFVVYGGIIGGTLGMLVYSKMKSWDTLEVFDFAVPSLALAQGFGRIGCFLAGCCYGEPTHLWIGVKFPADSLAPSGVYLQPTQLYSSAFDFALAAFLILYSRENKVNGRVFSMYIIVYSVGRFLIEFLRNDPRGSVGVLSTSQIISMATLLLGIVIYNIHKFKGSVNKIED